jgi:hypothetical protein
MLDYLLYYASPLLLYPPSPTRVTDNQKNISFQHIYRHLRSFLIGLVVTGTYQSVLLQLLPYGTGPASTPTNFYRWSSLLDMNIWCESLVYALLLQMYLSTFAAGLALNTTLLTGHVTHPFSDAPLQRSTSPSNFWGRRWNLLIHACLKNGVYKPIRSLGGHTTIAVVTTFIASALFHEWLLPSVMPMYPHTHGATIVFFLWQAMLVAIEMMIGGKILHYVSYVMGFFPQPFRTLCVIALGLPVGHWFLDSYIRSDFFVHGQFCFPMLLPISTPLTSIGTIPILFQVTLRNT